MSITNPPLEPPSRRGPSATGGHTSDAISNPPLDGAQSGPAAADHQNPPLDGSTIDTAALSDVLDNPRLDVASIETWFEAQLGSDTVPTTKSQADADSPSSATRPRRTKTAAQKTAKKTATSSGSKTTKKKATAAKRAPGKQR